MAADDRSSTRTAARLQIPGGAADVLYGLALATAAVLLFIVALSFDDVDHTGIGPATFPKGLTILLGITGLILAGRGIAGLLGMVDAQAIVIGRPLAVLAGIALVGAFPAMMTLLGYYVAIALWLPVFLLIAGYRKIVGIVLTTAGFMAIARVAFELMLGVRLP